MSKYPAQEVDRIRAQALRDPTTADRRAVCSSSVKTPTKKFAVMFAVRCLPVG